MGVAKLSITFFLQMAVILAACRVIGWAGLLQAGVIGPALFSTLVLMAIVTTLMASPIFEVVYGKQARASGELGALEGAAH